MPPSPTPPPSPFPTPPLPPSPSPSLSQPPHPQHDNGAHPSKPDITVSVLNTQHWHHPRPRIPNTTTIPIPNTATTPIPIANIMSPEMGILRWLPVDVKFDEYEGTPVYESMKPYCNPYEFVMEPYYRQGIWTMFRDYGWRLQPSFHQMFYLKDPVSDHVIDFYPGNNDHVDVPNVFVYGAAEMLALGAINSKQSFDAFIQGLD
ncbi:hypothetical protein BS17DRAFT_823471 [Gyrodon lividus]|nr:hypothetical protein BS17DRAFT_823471 [Gyrodon lividus]